MSKAPRILIIAGPNGAGKTTFARDFHALYAPLVDAWVLYDNTFSEPFVLDWSEKS